MLIKRSVKLYIPVFNRLNNNMKSSRDPVSHALILQRNMMARNGKLDLSNLTTDNLSGIDNQKTLKELYLNNSKITSFRTLSVQPCLKHIYADNSSVSSLSGLSIQPRLSKISLINTPVSKIDNFRIACLLVIGRRLSSINGVPVTNKERRMVLSYPPIAKALVDCGWVPIYPPPCEEDFRYLAKQFKIKAEESDFIFPFESEQIIPPSPKKKEEPTDFPGKLANILRPLGFGIRCGPEMNGDIVNAIDQICKTITILENQNDQTNSSPIEEEEDKLDNITANPDGFEE